MLDKPPEGAFAPSYAHQRPDSARKILDDEHLRLLRIGYFVSAAYTAAVIPFGLLYASMGVLLTTLPSTSTAPPPPTFISWFIGIIGTTIAAIATLMAVLKLMTAIRLKERRSRVLCLITAGISCLEIPWGTVLGVLTFIVLNRQSVRELFDAHR
jgi:hypothetical protein